MFPAVTENLTSLKKITVLQTKLNLPFCSCTQTIKSLTNNRTSVVVKLE